MRWHDLFDDLEAQMMHSEREAFEDEVRERVYGERAAIALGALLAASVDARVRVWLADGSHLDGVVADAAGQWLHLADGPREWLVPAGAIASLEGVAAGAPDPGLVVSRLSLGHALRALAEDGAEVIVRTAGQQIRGRITAVGADYVALGTRVVPFVAIVTVSPAH
jgi:hypothetical protein